MFRYPKAAQSFVFYVSVTLVIYLLKATILMRGSILYGRLSGPPNYDDVTYFVDAQERLQIFFNHGLRGFVQNLIDAPPHSPYSTLVATLSFLFAGPNLAGPYIMNAVAAALLSAMLFRLFRVNSLTTWCISIVLVTTLWFDNAVIYFHPDLIAGFATAIVAAVLIWQSEIIQYRARAIQFGIVAALILLLKPVAFAMVMSVWAVAFIIGAVAAYREEKSWGHIMNRFLFGASTVLVISGPYFYREILGILAYIHQGFVLERETWAHRLAASEHSLFYVNHAQSSFEPWLIVAGSVSIGIVASSFFVRDHMTVLRFAGLFLTALLAYLVPASMEVKHYLYGGVFFGCIAVCLILALHYLADRLDWDRLSDRPSRFTPDSRSLHVVRTSALGLISLFALAGLADKQGHYAPEFQRAATAEYDGVYNLFRDILQHQSDNGKIAGAPLVVFFPCPGPVAPHAYRFRGLVDSFDIKLASSFSEKDPQGTLEQLLNATNQASVVVIPNDNALKGIYPYPVNKLIPAFRAWLEQSMRFKHIGSIRRGFGADIFADVAVVVGKQESSRLTKAPEEYVGFPID